MGTAAAYSGMVEQTRREAEAISRMSGAEGKAAITRSVHFATLEAKGFALAVPRLAKSVIQYGMMSPQQQFITNAEKAIEIGKFAWEHSLFSSISKDPTHPLLAMQKDFSLNASSSFDMDPDRIAETLGELGFWTVTGELGTDIATEETTVTRTYKPGELMSNGLIAGDGPGAALARPVITKYNTPIELPYKPHGYTPGHWFRIKRLTIELARSGNYDQIYVHKRLYNATQGSINSLLAPDVIGVRSGSGLLDLFEVPSASQTVLEMQMKIQMMEKILGPFAGPASQVVPIQ
jgi:hypothetical protein